MITNNLTGHINLISINESEHSFDLINLCFEHIEVKLVLYNNHNHQMDNCINKHNTKL